MLHEILKFEFEEQFNISINIYTIPINKESKE